MSDATPKPDELFKARLDKLRRWRDELEIDGYGQRTDGLLSLTEARSRFNEAADDACRYRVTQTEWVANGQYPLANECLAIGA